MLTTVKEMSQDVAELLAQVRLDIEKLGFSWHPGIIQQEPFRAYQLAPGVLWSFNGGLHVFRGICPGKLVDHFFKHYKAITIVEKEDELVILGERFPKVQKIPK